MSASNKKTTMNCLEEGSISTLGLIAVLAGGALLPVQASINAALIDPLDNPIAPAAVSFCVGAIALSFFFAYTPGTKRRTKEEQESTCHLLKTAPISLVVVPGIIGGYYVAIAAVLGSQLGFSLLFVCVVAGQLLSAAVMDHVGFMGATVKKLNYFKGASIALVLIGCGLAVYERINAGNISKLQTAVFILMSVIAGIGLSIQLTLNAKLQRHMHSYAHRITWWSFTCGTIVLFISVWISTLFSSVNAFSFYRFEGIEFWKYLGGFLGAIYVFMAILLGPVLGLSAFFVASIAGQLLSSLVIDSFGLIEVEQIDVTASRIIGVILVFIAVTAFRFEDSLKSQVSKGNISNDKDKCDIES